MPRHEGPPLSTRALTVWAKSFTDVRQGLDLTGWLPLHQHLADTAAIAGHLWDEWMPSSLKRLLADDFGSELAARSLLVWLAGIHDVGKASPAFAVQVPALAEDMRAVGLIADPRIRDGEERRRTRHELVSFLAVRDHLVGTHGFSRTQSIRIASVAAAHHGRPAAALDIAAAEPLAHLTGDSAWVAVRDELLAAADAAYGSPEAIDAWRVASITQPSLVILSSLVIVADWIASSDLFAPASLGQQPSDSTAVRVAAAWRRLEFPRGWMPQVEASDTARLLTSRFDLPAGSTPHPTQTALVDLAMRVERPELMILEAEMGSGKTEAALLAAEILASRFGMTGIFVGLPTQATADGMFSRVLAWAERLGLDTPSSIFLARGRSQLNTEFAGKTREGYFRSIANDEASEKDASGSTIVAHRWFSDPRRGPLSSFVVGTVDQALYAGLRSRYVMLRHLALASKVVVIDEVHAYDEYMRTYLTRVLEWLGAYEVPVILLSATLPSESRRSFIDAYDRGRASRGPSLDASQLSRADRRAHRAQADLEARGRYTSLSGDVGYPAISMSAGPAPAVVVNPAAASTSRVLHIDRLDDSDPALVALLRGALRDRGNVAVIRNTVRRAQATAAMLRAAFPDVQVTLAHSRFIGLDRAEKDRALIDTYGRNGERPQQSIVVATQVIEQSLDVDFDLLVTDVAPIDLILQRSGRLHRHAGRVRPAPLRAPRVVLTGVQWDAAPPEFESGTSAIYPPATLLRTLAVLASRTSLTIPDDIAPLVETVYGPGDDDIPAEWAEALEVAIKKQRAAADAKHRAAETYTLPAVASDASLVGWVTGPDTDPELTPPGRATVRDGEDTLEVIVLQRDESGILRTPTWLPEGGGQQIPDNAPPGRALTRIILGCFLRLPAGMCHGNAIDRHIAALERRFELPTWHASHALKGELVLVFDHQGRAVLNEFDLSYSASDGLEYTRRAPVTPRSS